MGSASKWLSLIRLPYKGVSSLFAWGEVLPISKDLSGQILTHRAEVKLYSSTFNLPKFFFKQIRLFHACKNLKSQYEKGSDPVEMVHATKKVFLRSMSSIIAGLKVPLLLNKLQLIDLSRLSRTLASRLDKSETLLTLCLTGMKLVNSVWALEKKLKIEQMFGERHTLSPRTKNQIFKVGSYSLHFLSTSLLSAALFLGLPVSVMFTVVLSNLSFALAIARTSVQDKTASLSKKWRFTVHLPYSQLPV